MKRNLLGLVIIVTIAACTSVPVPIPEPEINTDSLVIGSVIINFYNGFNDHSQLAVDEGIKLYFTNLTTNWPFVVETDRCGFYYYLTNGSDEYILTKFEYSEGFDKYDEPISCTLNIPISTSTAKLIYMGHISIIFSKILGTTITIPVQYEVSFEVDWDRTTMLRYLENRESDCCWLDYEIIEHLFQVKDICTENIDD